MAISKHQVKKANRPTENKDNRTPDIYNDDTKQTQTQYYLQDYFNHRPW